MGNGKRVIGILLGGIMCLSMAACGADGGSAGGAGKDTTYTVWIGKGEDSKFYSDYHDNPILSFYLDKTYQGGDGKDVKVDMEFLIPAAGSESDNFNTLIATGDYPDVIDLAYYQGAVASLYEEGVILDITDYVEQYMPNYLTFLESNPDVRLLATNVVDGEKKYLQIYGMNTSMNEWQGLVYRRDWIVDYGKNPVTGEAFTGSYREKNEDGTWDTNTWQDDVVFPSGGPDPVYISDWEWMFEIFTDAMEDLEITDGYCTSIYYQGMSGMGVFNSSFGGGGATFYKNNQDKIAFGGNNDEMRAYLQCMTTWYENGWLDKNFAENTGVMPWRIDEAKVRQGKVGAWHGMEGQLFNQMNTGDPLTENIVVYGASYPINDIYGSAEQQNKEPYVLFQQSVMSKAFAVTDKAQEKDLITLFRFIDESYAEENSIMNGYGFNADQLKVYPSDFYTANGLEDGAYYDTGEKDSQGRTVYMLNDAIGKDNTLTSPSALGRVWGLQGPTDKAVVQNPVYTDDYLYMKSLWAEVYRDSGTLNSAFMAQMNADQAKEYSTVNTNVLEFMEKNVPNFINGTKDPYSDSDWEAYCKALEKYNPGRVTEILQEVQDVLQ